MLSVKQLLEIMPRCPKDKAQQYTDELNKAMQEANINTVLRTAAFLAQLAHESAEFKYMEEIADGKAYEGRKDLGNTQQGDGPRYKGRGPIQLTGRNNYTLASAALGVDLVNNPLRAKDPDVAFRIAGWYWTTHKINDKADTLDFALVTKAINGGLNHHDRRVAYYQKALQILARDTKLV